MPTLPLSGCSVVDAAGSGQSLSVAGWLGVVDRTRNRARIDDTGSWTLACWMLA